MRGKWSANRVLALMGGEFHCCICSGKHQQRGQLPFSDVRLALCYSKIHSEVSLHSFYPDSPTSIIFELLQEKFHSRAYSFSEGTRKEGHEINQYISNTLDIDLENSRGLSFSLRAEHLAQPVSETKREVREWEENMRSKLASADRLARRLAENTVERLMKSDVRFTQWWRNSENWKKIPQEKS